MSTTAPTSKWTVMVYLACDNNLTEEGVYSLKEMKRIDTGDRVTVTAQFDPRGRKTPVHRYVMNKEQKENGASQSNNDASQRNNIGSAKIADDVTPVVEGTKKYPYKSRNGAPQSGRPRAGAQATVVADPEADTGDPKTLFDFISWSVEHYPAERYMVVLAGHAGGSNEGFLLKDENPGNSLSIPDMQRVFRAVKEVLGVEVDILGMDVCLMSMGEICYELRGLTKYIVSAEGYSATAGWPYGHILQKLDAALQDGKQVLPEYLGRMIVDEYTNYYSEYMVGGFSSNLSLMDTSLPVMTDFSRKLKDLTELFIEELSRGLKLKEATGKSEFLDQIVLAHWEAQSYNGERFADLYDFCDLLGRRCAVKALPEDASDAEKEENTRLEKLADAIEKVKTEISDRVVKLSCYSGIDYQYSYGLAIYFPWAEIEPNYKNLNFATDAGWDNFLQAYTSATRRNPRGYMPGINKLWSNVELFRTTKYRTVGYRTVGYRDPGLNPVYSMRNPPLTLTEAGQSECQRGTAGMIDSLDVSFFK